MGEVQREIAMLQTCRSPNITRYYGSSVMPGTSRLLIAMELMAVSVADLVRCAAAAARCAAWCGVARGGGALVAPLPQGLAGGEPPAARAGARSASQGKRRRGHQ